MKRQKIIIVSGYFNPLHKGHIELFHNAKAEGDKLFVIVNNDLQRELKGSKVTNYVMLSIDNDRTVCKSLEKISKEFSTKYDLYFANGGDQNNESIPELKICNKLGIKLIEGLGNKIQSSSWLLNK